MNRLSWRAPEPPPTSSDALPPPTRTPGGPVRVLFVHGAELGFSTSAGEIERLCAVRADLDAVHIRVPIRGLMRAIAAAAPERWHPYALGTTRRTLGFGHAILRLLRTTFPVDRFDVVHLSTQQRGWPMVKLRGRTRARFVVNLDATVPAWCRAFGWARSPLDLDARMERRVLASADLVACASRWVSDSALSDCAVPSERLFLNKPCATPEVHAPAPSPNSDHDANGPSRRPVRLVFVGNDWERKGGPRLIRWHQERWRDIAEVHVCSRTAPQDHSLKNVVWHGQTPRADLLGKVLPMCDVFVLPTRNDTFVIAAQEALGAGLPVVSSRIAGIPEVVRHGRTGFLCDPGSDRGYVEALDRLIADAPLRTRMSKAARLFAGEHLSAATWHNHLFDQIVALADGRPARYAPAGVDIRRTDDEPASPTTAAESAAAAATTA